MPPALIVSIIRRPAMVTPVSLPVSWRSRMLSSIRFRETSPRTSRLRAPTATPMSVSFQV